MEDINKAMEIAAMTRKELSGFIPTHECFYDDWSCSCLVCSWVLDRILKAFGIKSELCIGEFDGCGHAFVMVGNHIVDITATQFLLPEIYIEEFDENDSFYIIRSKNEKAIKDIINWPTEQKPETYKKQLNKVFKTVIESVI